MAESLRAVLKMAVQLAIPLAAFATGLRAATAEPLWLARRPGLLVRSLLAILIVVPIGTVLFLQSIAAPPAVKAGLTMAVIAVGIGPPAAFKRSQSHDDAVSFELGLNVLLLALAIVYIPAFVAVHGAIFHHDLRLGPGAVAKVVLGKALIPLVLGGVVGRLAPRLVTPVRRYANVFVHVVLLLVIVMAVAATWRALFGLGVRAWLTCGAIVLGEILIGHAAGGPGSESRRVLASFSAMRFPALALLLASMVPRHRELIPIVVAYVLVSVVLVGVLDAVTSRRGHHGASGQRPGPRPPPFITPVVGRFDPW
jgi:BASS family bile acid:Na+ symporter